VEVGVEQCVGVLLLVLVRPSLADGVTGVTGEVVKCGFGSDAIGVKAGNKGGVAVRLEIFGASICVINSHLPAGQSHPEERNSTFHEVRLEIGG
jgi:phosphatidylinositol-bisphosphatase